MRKILITIFTGLVLFLQNAEGQLTLTMSNVEVDKDAQASVDVTVSGFTNLLGAQFSINYDSTLLTFANATNFSAALPGLSSAAVSGPNGVGVKKGQITFSWFDQQGTGKSLTNGARLFTIVFSASGEKCKKSDIVTSGVPRVVEIINSALQPVNLINIKGSVSIKCDNNPVDNCISPVCSNANNLAFIGATVSSEKDKTICVPITVKNFRMMQSGQGSIKWDPSILQYTEVKTPASGGIPGFSGGFNANNTPAGEFRYLWANDNPAVPLTLADNAVIMELCFKVIGISTQVGCIQIGQGSLPTEWENNTAAVPVCFTYGKVTITSAPLPGAVVVRVGTVNSQLNQTVCVDVSVEKFINVLGAGNTFTWNADQLEFVRTDNYNLEGLNASAFSNTSNSLKFLWLSPNAITKADGHKIYTICFRVKQCLPSSAVNITGTPDIVGQGSVQLPSQGVGGSVTCTNQPVCSSTSTLGTITNVSCSGGTDGSVVLSVTGSNLASHNIVWKNAAGAVVKASASVTSGTNLTGVAVGVYTYEVTFNSAVCNTGTATVTQPAVITIPSAGVVKDNQCNDKGAINISATSGGNGGFSYAWTPDQGNNANLINLNAGTYSVTVTDSKGCKANATFTVANLPSQLVIPTANSVTNAQCEAKGSINITGVTGANGAITYAWTPNQGNISNPSNLNAGTYTVTVTDTKGCTASATFTVANLPSQLVIPTANAVTNAQCDAKGSINITGVTGGNGSLAYAWTPDQGNISNPSNLNAGTYTVTVTDTKGCTASASFTVANLPSQLVIPAANVVTNAQCDAKGNIDLRGITGGTGALTYAWTPDQGNTATPANLNAGTYSVTVTDSKGCKASATFTVVNLPSQVVIPSTNMITSAQCESKGSINITGITGANGAITYAWTPDQGNTANPTNLNAGSYSVTVTDSKGCKASATLTVENIPSQVAIPTTNVIKNAQCDDKGAININGVIGANGALTYAWTPEQGNTANPTNLNAGTYSVTVTDSKGCKASATFTVQNLPSQIVIPSTIVIKNAQCDDKGAINVNGITGGSGSLSYAWTPDQGNTANPTNLNPGTYSVTVTDSKGCKASTTFTVANLPSQIVIPNTGVVTNVTCNQKGSINLTAVTGGSGTLTYNWIPALGNTANPTNLNLGNYTVTVTDSKNCTATATFTIANNQPELILSSTVTNVKCKGGGDGAIQINIAGGCSNYAYVWTAGLSGPNPQNLKAGIYTVTVTDASLPLQSKILSVTVTEPAADVSIALTGALEASSSIAGDGKITLTLSGGTPNYKAIWSGPTTITDGNTSGLLEANNLKAGSYNVTVTDANGCSAVRSNIVIGIRAPVETAPKIGSAGVSTAFNGFGVPCFGDSGGAITAKLSEGSYPVTVTLKSGATTVRNIQVNGPDINFTGLVAGSYTIEVSNGKGTVISNAISITQPTKLAGIADINCTIKGKSEGNVEIKMNNTGAGNYGFSWFGISDLDNKIENLAKGFYNVTVTDGNKCELRLTNLEVGDCKIAGECYSAATVITPNGDGINDLFIINCIDNNTSNDLTVFDRWGRTIYSESNYANTWQGVDKDNESLIEGAYIWVLTVNFGQGRREIYKGTVTLLRTN